MSSSRLMSVGQAITETRPRIPASLALALVGLIGMVFMCSALYWVGAQVTGWNTAEKTVQSAQATVNTARIGQREAFAVITAQDKVNCLARAYWQIVTIQTPTGTVYECHPQ